MRHKKISALLLILVFSFAACSGEVNEPNGSDPGDAAGEDSGLEDAHTQPDTGAQPDAFNPDPDADTSTEPDADASPEPSQPQVGELVFRLKNRTARTLFTYPSVAGSPCGYQNGWLKLSIDDEQIVPIQDCTRCECGDEDCNICAQECPGGASEVHAGDAREFKWDKKIWSLDRVDACESAELAVGQEVRAEFCWGEEFDSDTGNIEGYRCEAKTVTLDDQDQTVEIEVDQGQDEWAPGDIFKSENNWLEARAGDMPLVISAPHGGTLEPSSIPDRTCESPTTSRDMEVDQLAAQAAERVKEDHGMRPYVVIAHIRRPKIDLNRDLYPATCGNDKMEEVWHQYHEYIETALAQAIEAHGYAIYIDLHGHGHTKQRLELGYARTKASIKKSYEDASEAERLGKASSLGNLIRMSNLTFQELLTGDNAFGTLIQSAGTPAVPSKQDPFPLEDDGYFNGGYNTRRYTHADYSRVFGWQIETHKNARWGDNGAAGRKKFAQDFSKAIKQYIDYVEANMQ